MLIDFSDLRKTIEELEQSVQPSKLMEAKVSNLLLDFKKRQDTQQDYTIQTLKDVAEILSILIQDDNYSEQLNEIYRLQQNRN